MIVTTHELCKDYASTVALSNVELRVPEGSVYGLVGPNGAGKTTLLGILAGLRKATSGTIEINAAWGKVAVLPDTPQFDPWLTGREVVDLARTLTDRTVPEARVDEVLEQAGLADAARRTVGGYSRGMLQRLGVASTVVGQPTLLMLDEPSSALDPAGRREVLDLLARLRGDATVIFSSHILGDVQEVCDKVGILKSGELLFQGSIDELLVGTAAPAYRLHVRPPADNVVETLRSASWVTAAEALSRDEIRVSVESMEAAEQHLVATLAATGSRIVGFGPEAATLEQVFLELTS